MGREDTTAGKIKQAKGKANEVIGAVRGKTSQELKGKVQKGVGKLQEKAGEMSSRNHPRGED